MNEEKELLFTDFLNTIVDYYNRHPEENKKYGAYLSENCKLHLENTYFNTISNNDGVSLNINNKDITDRLIIEEMNRMKSSQ